MDLFVHSNAEFLEELSYYPVEIDSAPLEHLVDIWEKDFWPRKDLYGMAGYTLNVLRYQQIIFHILPTEDWEKAQDSGVYSPDGMTSEGFIHCSRVDQVERTLTHLFKDQPGLLLFMDCRAKGERGNSR